jgi:acyl dehydratase
MTDAVTGVPAADRHFEDYLPGLSETLGPIAMTEEAIIEFAQRYDPQAIHIDPARAAAGPFGGLIASGWQTVCVVMRELVQGYLAASASLASPGIDELRWLKPVRPGDTLTGWVECAGKVPSKSKPTMGVIHEHWQVTNQNGELVMTTKGINMVRRRPS